jgi:hypothetical protein
VTFRGSLTMWGTATFPAGWIVGKGRGICGAGVGSGVGSVTPLV